MRRGAARRARARARQQRVAAVFIALAATTGLAVWAVSGLGHHADLSASTRVSHVAAAPKAAPKAVPAVAKQAERSPEPRTRSQSGTMTLPKASGASKTPEAVRAAAVPFPGAPSIEPNSFARLTPKHRYIAITIDDGLPFNQEMLDLLVANDVKCTTFLLGSAAKGNPRMVKSLRNAGFEIANHSWNHPDLTKASAAEIRSQLKRTQTAISAVTGNQAPYFRPPYGATNARVRQIAAEEGYTVVMWSKTFGDSGKHANAYNCYERAISGLEPGDIVLCHWGKDHTFEAMKSFLAELKRRDIKAVTVSELLADSQ